MKKILISMLILIYIISISISVNAATTGGISLVASKDTIKAGDEISIVVKATDSNKLNTVEYSAITIKDAQGKATSAITVKSVEAVGDNWAKMNNEGKTAFVYSGGATESADVFKVTLTVGDVTEGQYTINVEGLTVYSAHVTDDTTNVGTKSVSVKAIIDETTAGDKTPSKDNTSTGNSTDDKSDSGKKGNTNTNKNKVNKLPQTGAENTVVIAIVALGIVSIVSYISYRKYNNI